MERLTENRDGIRSWRQRLTDYQQKHDERQQNCDLEIDFLSRLDGKEEAEEWDGVDEEAGEDEVDDVEKTAARHVNGESDVGVRFRAAGVHLTTRTPGDEWFQSAAESRAKRRFVALTY